MTRHIANGRAAPAKVPDKLRLQREAAEDLARVNAERLLTPVEPAVSTPSYAPASPAQPSLEQRLADIDRRARERAVEEKRQLAAHYLMEARNAFRRAVSRTSDDAVKSAYEEMQRLERLAGEAGNAPADSGSASPRPSASDAGRTPRERRSTDSLRVDAQKLAEWLRANPSSRGSAATQATGVVVKQPLNLRTFIEKYLPGTKVRTEGQKAGTLYSLS